MKAVNPYLPTMRLLADIISPAHFAGAVNKPKISMHHPQLQSPSSCHSNYRKLQNQIFLEHLSNSLQTSTKKWYLQYSCLTDGKTETKAKLPFQDYTASQWQSTITIQSLLVSNPIILFPKSIKHNQICCFSDSHECSVLLNAPPQVPQTDCSDNDT